MIKSWDLESFADNIALKDDNGQSVTYRSLAEETDRIAEDICLNLFFILLAPVLNINDNAIIQRFAGKCKFF